MPENGGDKEWRGYKLSVENLVWARNYYDGYNVHVYIVDKKDYQEHIGTFNIDYNLGEPEIEFISGEEEFAKGGNVAVKKSKKQDYEYVHKENIKQLSAIINGELKKTPNIKVLSGVYIESTPEIRNSLKEEIMQYARENEYEKGYAAKYKKFVKDTDIEYFHKQGVPNDMIKAFYCGVRSVLDYKGDYEMSELEGIFSSNEEGVKRDIEKAKANAKNNSFEIGLKYPDYNWDKILPEKYTEKIIKGESLKRGDYTEAYNYKIRVYDKLVIGKAISYTRTYKDGSVEETPTIDAKGFLRGGYLGMVSSDPAKLMGILKKTAKQTEGYVKDVNVLINRLGGIATEALDKNKIKYKKGGNINTPLKYIEQKLAKGETIFTEDELDANGFLPHKINELEYKVGKYKINCPNVIIRVFYIN